MSYSINKEAISDFFFPATIASVFFLTVLYLQPFGFFLSILSPLPIIFICLQKGKKAGLHTLAVVTIIISLFGNVRYGVIYFFEYGVMAMIIGETIKRHYSVERVIVLSVLVSLCAGGVIFGSYIIFKGINPYALLSKQIYSSLDQTIVRYEEAGGMSKDNIDAMKRYSKNIAEMFINSFPALVVASSLFGALINYFLTKVIWLRYKGNGWFDREPLSSWKLPEYIIWIFIGGGVMMIAPVSFLKNIGLNVLIIMVLLYFLQGFAIVNFYFKKFSKIPLFFKIVAYLMIMTQFIFIVLIVGIGIFDLWIDFRKLSKDGQS